MGQQQTMTSAEFRRLNELNKISGQGNAVKNLETIKGVTEHPEDNLQMSCVSWFYTQYPKYLIHHSANGGKRETRTNAKGEKYCPEGQRFKKMGARAGFPDTEIISGIVPVFYIELKSDKGKLSPNQIETHELLRSLGCHVYTCNSIESFMKTVNNEFKNNVK